MKSELILSPKHQPQSGGFNAFGDVAALQAYALALRPNDAVEDTVVKILYAHGMNLPIATVIDRVVIINGKASPDAHLARALLQRGMVTAETLEDWKPIHRYQSGNISIDIDTIEANPEQYKIYATPAQYTFDKDKGLIKDGIVVETGQIAVARMEVVDYRTRILFSRNYFTSPNEMTKVTEIGEFRFSEAMAAGLTTKTNWKQWPRDCLYARAYSRGARRIADDLIWGAYSRLEYADMSKYDEVLEREQIID